jgi:hypothetical protein
MRATTTPVSWPAYDVDAGVVVPLSSRLSFQPGVAVAAVAAVEVLLELAQPVGLQQPDEVVLLVGVVLLRVVDVPDQQPLAGQLAVVAGAPAVLEQEVLLALRAAGPQAVHVRLSLTSGSAPGRRGDVLDRHPALLRLAPGRRVGRDVAAGVPRAARHEAPVADARRWCRRCRRGRGSRTAGGPARAR